MSGDCPKLGPPYCSDHKVPHYSTRENTKILIQNELGVVVKQF